jgi:hypothetical protein
MPSYARVAYHQNGTRIHFIWKVTAREMAGSAVLRNPTHCIGGGALRDRLRAEERWRRHPAWAVGVGMHPISGTRCPALVDLAQKHRDIEALAGRLAWEQGQMAFRELAALAGVLGVEMRGQARTEKERVLAVFGAQGVNGFIQIGEPLHADHFPEQIELPVIGFREMMQDDTGGAVARAGHKHGVEGRGNRAKKVIGKTGGSRQLDLTANVAEVLGPQKDEHPLRRQLVAPGLDAALSTFFASCAYTISRSADAGVNVFTF